MSHVTLSYSSLSLFVECPRCFWLEKVRGIGRPETIFPSLPGGMDGVIKKYFDRFRSTGALPPELRGRVKGTLFPDQHVLDGWRDWRRGLRYTDQDAGATLTGALDDCLVQDGAYMPLDYKTRGYPAKAETSSYYQDQLNIYTLLLQENGHQPNKRAYLVFYHPLEQGDGGRITFHMHSVSMVTDPERALALFRSAVSLLRSNICPPASRGCGFCAWVSQLRSTGIPLLSPTS